VLVLLGLCLLALPAAAAPNRGESRRFAQPDGAEVEVRLFGTKLYLRAESPDGYTLAYDRTSGWICYAEQAADGSLLATTVHYLGAADAATAARLSSRGIVPGLRASSAVVAQAVATTRAALDPGPDAGHPFHASLDGIALAKYNPVLGSGKGLVVLVDFSDRAGTVATSEYDKAFNGDTYDSLGSIRIWIEAISYGKYTASHTVVGYMRAAFRAEGPS
jgi:hypothetical protein